MQFELTRPAARALAVAVVASFALAGQGAAAQPAVTGAAFEGVWKVTKVVRTGADAVVDTHPQPSLQIFSGGYFAIVRDNSAGPRQASPAPKDPANLTDAEKLARYAEWAPFGASAGTYEVKGDVLITRNIVAKNVVGTTAATQPEAAAFRFEGDSFVVTVKSAPGAPASVTERTYTRVR